MSPNEKVWQTRGFESFRQGTMGNAGQDLYVSRAGVLQRIHLFDLDKDGYVDLAVANHKIHGDHIGVSFVLWNGPRGFDLENATHLPTSGPHGMLHTKPGNVLDNGDQEYFISAAFELPPGAAVERLSWQAELPPRTWLRAQLRFACSQTLLEQAPWIGPGGESTFFEKDQAVQAREWTGQWVQYRLALGALNSGNTPRVTAVNVFYT